MDSKPARKTNAGNTRSGSELKPADCARDVVVSVTVAVAVPPAASVAGDVTVQETPAGAVPCAAHVSETLPANALTDVSLSSPVPVPPAAIEIFVEEAPEVLSARVKLGTRTPIPVSATVLAYPDPLETSVSVPLRVPVATGLKVMDIAQLAPAATTSPHVFVWVNSGAEATESVVIAMLETPVFVKVKTCDELPLRAVAGNVALPVNVAVGDAATENGLLVTETVFPATVKAAVSVSAACAFVTTRLENDAMPFA